MSTIHKAKREVYPYEGDVGTSFGCYEALKRKVKDDNRLIANNNVLRFISLCSVVLMCLCLGLFAYYISLPKTELVVVSVNDIGESRYVGTTRGIKIGDYGMQEACVKNILEKYIWNTYTISKDSDLMYENFRSTLYFLDAKKRKSYMRMINTVDPFKEVGRITRSTKVETIIPISPSSYQADFYVSERELTGYNDKTVKYRGIFSIAQLDEEGYAKLTEEERRSNPLGIYITDYNIVEVN